MFRITTMDHRSPLSELQASLNALNLNERFHQNLYRFMKSVETTLLRTKTVDERETAKICQTDRGYAPVVFLSMFQPSPSESHRSVFIQPSCRTKRSGLYTLRYFGPSFWNKLPVETRSCSHKSSAAIQAIKGFLRLQS